MDKLVAIRIKHNDGTYSNEIPLSVLAINIDWDGTHSLVDVLGNVDLNKGSIQEQINALITTITPDNVQWDLTHTLSDVLGDVDLDKGDLQTQIDNISDGEIQVDSTLTAAGKAADAKAVGDNLKNVVRVGNSNVTNFTSIILGDTAEQVNLLDQSDLIGINARLSALENSGAGSNIQVDQTLSVQGMAADAKAVGDALDGLNDNIDDLNKNKADAIVIETDEKYSHINLNNSDKLSFIGNEYAFRTARYANHLNNIPVASNSTELANGVTVNYQDHFIIFNGDAQSTNQWRPIDSKKVSIPAGSYKIYVEVDPGSTILGFDATLILLSVDFIDGTSQRLCNCYIKNNDREFSITTTQEAVRITILVQASTGTTYNNYKIWIGMYPENTVFIDTLQSIPNGSIYNYTNDTLKEITEIDTVQHKSSVSTIINTKLYIDTHTSDVELVYVYPEMFGAVGDGVTDDTQALQDCINYAINNAKVMRAFGRYKTTATLNIVATNNDIYINRIDYTGSNVAIIISGRNNHFYFGYINAQNTGASCLKLQRLSSDTVDTNRNVIEGIAFYSNLQTILVSADDGYYLTYIVFKIKSLYSAKSDCIYASKGDELAVYDTYFACANGWAVNSRSIKLYNCTIEANCYGGVYSTQCTIVGCRVRELMDALMPGNPHHDSCSGIIWKYKQPSNNYVGELACTRIFAPDNIYYDSIDVSEFTPNPIRNFYSGPIAVIDSPIIYGDANYSNGYVVIGSKMIINAGRKICIPTYPSSYTINIANYDMRDSANLHLVFPTKFIIDIENCVIHLSNSYCGYGYNNFIVVQNDISKLATIYDNNENIIFDGSSLGIGTYKLACVVDYSADPTALSPSFLANNGKMDVWTVEKIT